MQQWLRYSLLFIGGGIVIPAVAALIGSPSAEGAAALAVAVLPLLISLGGGGALGWTVTIRGGGLPLLIGLIGIFGLGYSTTLSTGMAQTFFSFRVMAYAYLVGGLFGGAVGSMKREIDRQRAKRGLSK